MDFLPTILFVVSLTGSVLLWMLGIRPYLRKHKEGYNTGANLAVAAWVDWQVCGEIAKRDNDSYARSLYRSFLLLQIMGMGALILMFI